MLHHAYLIKGWLLAKDPPKEVTEALEAIIRRLREPVVMSVRPVEWETEVAAVVEAEEPADVAPEEVEPSPDLPAPEQLKARRKHNMSPEARAAAGERMRAMQARKRAEREGIDGTRPVADQVPDFTEAELRITVPKPRRKSQLTDADWPEIKEMLDAGRSRAAIASDYDEELEDLEFFVASCERREAKAPGEAGASPLSKASDAARPTW